MIQFNHKNSWFNESNSIDQDKDFNDNFLDEDDDLLSQDPLDEVDGDEEQINEVRYIDPDNLDRYNKDEIEKVKDAQGNDRYRRKTGATSQSTKQQDDYSDVVSARLNQYQTGDTFEHPKYGTLQYDSERQGFFDNDGDFYDEDYISSDDLEKVDDGFEDDNDFEDDDNTDYKDNKSNTDYKDDDNKIDAKKYPRLAERHKYAKPKVTKFVGNFLNKSIPEIDDMRSKLFAKYKGQDDIGDKVSSELEKFVEPIAQKFVNGLKGLSDKEIAASISLLPRGDGGPGNPSFDLNTLSAYLPSDSKNREAINDIYNNLRGYSFEQGELDNERAVKEQTSFWNNKGFKTNDRGNIALSQLRKVDKKDIDTLLKKYHQVPLSKGSADITIYKGNNGEYTVEYNGSSDFPINTYSSFDELKSVLTDKEALKREIADARQSADRFYRSLSKRY